jgi:hypothetical protein
MTRTVGAHEYTYEEIDGWGKLPPGWTFDSISCVGVDRQDRIYVGFDRNDPRRVPKSAAGGVPWTVEFDKKPPIMVFDAGGNYLSCWGSGAAIDVHSIHVDSKGSMFITDHSEHVVVKFTLDGRPLMVLGTRGQPSDTGLADYTEANRSGRGGTVLRAAGPFNSPTKTVTSRSGDIYVTDGDGNSRVHRFSADGRLISSWGAPGNGAPYEFDRPHSLCLDSQDTVYVCDRLNNRIQIFSPDGKFIDQWTDVSHPADICIDANEIFYIGECPPNKGISVRNKKGVVLARLELPATPTNPHSLCVDSNGNLYVTQGKDEKINKYIRIG